MSDDPPARGVPCPQVPGPYRVWVLHLTPRPSPDIKTYSRSDARVLRIEIPPQPPKKP